jgi:hypothetical protein
MTNIRHVCCLAFALVVAGCSGGDGGSNVNHQNNDNHGPHPVCGNGVIELSTNIDWNETCEELSCTDRCKLDTTLCTGRSPCGNVVINPGETCDGTNVNGFTCSSLGEIWGDGTDSLVCMPNCANINPYVCHRLDERCGDGIVDFGTLGSPGEACDDGPNNSDTIPDACRTNCLTAGCGDGVIDTGEECDDGIYNSNGAPDGCRLYCAPGAPCTCRLAYCGDDVMDTGEECDGRDLGGLDCTDHGYSGGLLACAPDCTIDATGCTP